MEYYVADAFTKTPFSGNPAAICVLGEFPSTALMQKIAAENNLSETAFAVPSKKLGVDYDLKWFTPTVESPLCGHATLATSFVICNYAAPHLAHLTFDTLSGLLHVTKKGDLFEMDFPAYETKPYPVTELMVQSIGVTPVETYLSETHLIFVLESDRQVREAQPDLALMAQIEEGRGCVLTAQGDDCDFVSRVFLPKRGIPEDPVNGSSHSSTIPLWAKKLDKTSMVANMRSQRGGTLYCTHVGDRVKIGGNVVLYAKGKYCLPE